MSLDIWTLCAGPSRVSPDTCKAWRVVEAQHEVSTRGLVDNLEEQAILEDIVEEVKPPRPVGPGFAGLHFLLWTPFRYPPLHHGSRFGSAHERSLWYGAIEVETSLTERAYHQLLFAIGTDAELPNLACRWTAFRVAIRARRAVDLCGTAFAAFHSRISSPTSYADSQALGTKMRSEGIEAFRYPSARWPRKRENESVEPGVAVALFEPVFSHPKPMTSTTWEFYRTKDGCEIICRARGKILTFRTADFEVDGEFPAPGLRAG